MGIIIYKPTSAGRRNSSVHDFAEITCDTPLKSLLAPKRRKGGRNCYGRVTTRFRGGGHKKQFRIIDIKRDKEDISATVSTVEYDPNRSVRIALLQYKDGEKRYVIAWEGIQVGEEVVSGEKTEPKNGNCMKLKNIPQGLSVHNVEMSPGRGGQLARSAGSSAQVLAKDKNYVILSLPSGEQRYVFGECKATIGQCGNTEHNLVRIGKAGRKRWSGIRPRVRGTAKNPVDHPMGGGDARSHGGRHPCSPNGVLSKGGKTRKHKKPSNSHIIRRRKKGPHVGGGS